jgi:hypothetical protein
MKRGRTRTRALALLIGIDAALSACATEPDYGGTAYAYDDYGYAPVYGTLDFGFGGWGGWHHGWDDGHDGHFAGGHFGHGFAHSGFHGVGGHGGGAHFAGGGGHGRGGHR